MSDNYTQRIITESVRSQGLLAWLGKVVGNDTARELVREAYTADIVAYVVSSGTPEERVYRPEEIKIVRTWDE